MCFSPEMDLVAGFAITAVGVDTLRHGDRRDQVPLATLPLVFGIHQLIETLVWWEQQGKVCGELGGAAARVYLFIALFLVPIFVPFAFAALRLGRSVVLDRIFLGSGVVAGTVGLWALAVGPVDREIQGHHIAYDVDVPWSGVVLLFYVVATCGPGISARSRDLWRYGFLNLGAVAALAWLDQTALVSLWCFWAAVTSVMLNYYVRRSVRESDGAWPTICQPSVGPRDEFAS